MSEQANETTKANETTPTSVSGETANEFDPISAIREIKENSVSKQEYAKVVAEKNRYAQALINGEGIGQTEVKKKEVDVDGLRRDLFTKDLTNLDFIDKSLQLRDAVIEKEHYDIFVGKPTAKYSPSEDDYVNAQRVADLYKQCIDVADGDPEVFTRELQRITVDAPNIGRINPNIRR